MVFCDVRLCATLLPMLKKVALITGSAKRIGKAMAIALAEDGYAVAVHYQSSQVEAQRLVDQLKKKRVKAQSFAADLKNAEDVRRLMKDVQKSLGKPILLVNNASVYKPNRLTDQLEVLDQNWAIHTRSVYLLAALMQKMSGKGHVINLLDAQVDKNKTEHFPYLLSKKSLRDFTKMAAVELAPKIRVNAIAPGFILPPKGASSAFTQKRLKRVPLGKKGKVDHIVMALRYLLANDFVTGQILYVDGGERLV